MRERIRGPNARPVEYLIEVGAKTALRINSQYQDFARRHVDEISTLMTDLAPQSPAATWQALVTAVQDLRSSSATCGREEISLTARSLERALDSQYRSHPKLMAVMRLHLDALRLGVQGETGEEELRALAPRLKVAVNALNPSA
jgi:HPt (histidine-containing phosphotransfer) domain-containing protein